MFIHNKDLQFEVRVDRPDPRFASLLMDQFGGANGELTAALQYFTQAFVLRQKNPKMYDLFMDIATEELSHLEMVGSMITMLLDGLNDNLHIANQRCDWMPAVASADGRDSIINSVSVNPMFLVLSGGDRTSKTLRGTTGPAPSSTPTVTPPSTCATTSPRSRAPRSSTNTSSR